MQVEKIMQKSIDNAVEIMRRGGTVVYPTETAYALGVDATNPRAVAKIFKIKNRPADKNLPAICHTKKQVEQFFELPALGWKLWLKYWPKPVSIILERKSPSLILPLNKGEEGGGTPVRISSNKTARDLARKLNRPITATSANISGLGAIYDAKEIIEEFEGKKYQPDMILDGGKLPKRPPSTIVKIIGDKIEIIRRGEVEINSKFQAPSSK